MRRRSAGDIAAAQQLFAEEKAHGDPSAGHEDAAVRIYERFAGELAPLIGVAGFRAVVVRSAALTAKEFPCFAVGRAVDGSITDGPADVEGFRARLRELEPPDTTAAAVAFFATMIGLLTGLIGEPIVLRMLTKMRCPRTTERR